MKRNPYGSIYRHKIKIARRTILVFDAKRRYTRTDGTPAQKFRRCYSAPEAEMALLNFRTEIENESDAVHEPARCTFSDAAGYYKTEHVKSAVIVNGDQISGYRSNTSYRKRVVDELIEIVGADKPLESVTYEDLRKVKEIISQRQTRKKSLPSVSTINEKMSILRRIFNVAIELDWLDKNPFRKARKKTKPLIDRKKENRRNRMLTFEEEQRLFDALQPHTMKFEYQRRDKWTKEWKTVKSERYVDRRRLIPIITLALDTAQRVGEVFNMEPWQVDFPNDVIYLTREAAQSTKTGQPGILPMTRRVRAIMLEHIQLVKGMNEKIFPRFEYKRSFRTACTEAGIDDFQLRDSRSTGATRMVLAGSPESQVMKTTRHKNLKIFLDHYTNVDRENARSIGRNLSDFVEKQISSANQSANDALTLKPKTGWEPYKIW